MNVYVAWYVLYAFVQAVLVARYIDSKEPLAVIGIMIGAPLVTVVIVITALGQGIKWLLTVGKK